jgi:phosphoribosylformylglycinamidine synthase
VACTGARPLALTNCLNFGNPEKPEIMWQLREAIEGLGEAAAALGTPVVSGNVSLYNETSGVPIHPTPTVAVVGLLEPWDRFAVSWFPGPGLAVVLLGETREELGGSEWLRLRRGLEAGLPPRVDLEAERRLHALLGSGVRGGLILSAHDVSQGGLAVALAECCFTGPALLGADVRLEGRMRPDALLFGEAPGRVVAAAPEAEPLLAAAREEGVPARVVGRTVGAQLRIGGPAGPAWIDAPVARLRAVFERALPRRLGEPDPATGRGA